MVDKGNFMKRSQDLDPFYHDAGQFIVGRAESWKNKVPILGGNTLPIIVPRFSVQDIDEEEDWNEAEQKFSVIKNKAMKKSKGI
jgi:N-acylneuraminate cytidylyltransferase